MIPELGDLGYEERLKERGLETRRLKKDQIKIKNRFRMLDSR